jgi:thioester reductase-like protein
LGTKNTLNLAIQLNQFQCNESVTFHHISSVAVAGNYEGCFTEADFDKGQTFNNTYEQTKFESEKLVMSYSQDLRVIVYRPAIMTGDSLRGVTTNFKMLYQPVHFFAYELFNILPASPNSRYSFVPVDQVAEAIILLSKQKSHSGQVYQLLSPDQINLQEFIDSICEFFCSRPPNMGALNGFERESLSELQWKLVNPFIPYFNYKVTFNAECTNLLLRKMGFFWIRIDKNFLNVLYQYCRECGFVRKSTFHVAHTVT